MKNVKIIVCYSFDTEIQKEFTTDRYLKFGAGEYRSEKMDIDETCGINIKDINPYVNEQSMIYFTLKNYEKIGNPDYIGFNHYRRSIKYTDELITEKNVLCNWGNLNPTIYEQFKNSHIIKILDEFIYHYLLEYPEDKEILKEFLNQNFSAGCNNFIMSKNNFFDYGKYLETEIEIAKKLLNLYDFNSFGTYQKRQLGFITERFFGFWVYKMSKMNKINIVNCDWNLYDNRTIYH